MFCSLLQCQIAVLSMLHSSLRSSLCLGSSSLAHLTPVKPFIISLHTIFLRKPSTLLTQIEFAALQWTQNVLPHVLLLLPLLPLSFLSACEHLEGQNHLFHLCVQETGLHQKWLKAIIILTSTVMQQTFVKVLLHAWHGKQAETLTTWSLWTSTEDRH